MKFRSVAPMQIAKIGYIVLSAALIAVGIIFIIQPAQSMVVIARIVGILSMVFGAIKVFSYYSKDLYRLAFQYDFEFGIVLLILGLVVTIRPQAMITVIFIAFGVMALLDGLFKMRIAWDARKFGIRAWWLTLAMAILTGLIGIAMIFSPWETIHVLSIFLGITLICEGVLNLWVVVNNVKIIKNQQPDFVDSIYEEE